MLEGLRDGWYRVTELEPAPGFTIKEPATQEFYIEGGGNKSLTFENVPSTPSWYTRRTASLARP